VWQPDGTLRAERPVPIGGKWKSFVRFHKGRTMLSAAVRMPADPVLKFPGFAAPTGGPVQRALVRDTRLLQIERKNDGPLWAWTPAFLLVLVCDLSLIAFMGFVSVRLGRLTVRAAPSVDRLTIPFLRGRAKVHNRRAAVAP
jgi:hypothetical protein